MKSIFYGAALALLAGQNVALSQETDRQYSGAGVAGARAAEEESLRRVIIAGSLGGLLLGAGAGALEATEGGLILAGVMVTSGGIVVVASLNPPRSSLERRAQGRLERMSGGVSDEYRQAFTVAYAHRLRARTRKAALASALTSAVVGYVLSRNLLTDP